LKELIGGTMLRTMLTAKIHRAHVTQRDLNYVGSITIDNDLLEASGILPNEKVDVYNISNGNRFATYVLKGESGTGIIGVNGAAARLVSIDDKVIIAAFGQLDEVEVLVNNPNIIIVDDDKNLEFYKV
jgi:aspartate 1-decarboxylase